MGAKWHETCEIREAECRGFINRSRRWKSVLRDQLKSPYKNPVPRTECSLYGHACCIIFWNTLDTGFNQKQWSTI